MTTLARRFSAVFFAGALVALLTLLITDTWNQLRWTSIHRSAGALSLMLIGSSLISLQLSSQEPWNKKIKEALLGAAFLFWGTVQFLPSSPWTTALDSLVILIFVVDISQIIAGRLKAKHG